MVNRVMWTSPAAPPSVQGMESAVEIRQLRAFVALVDQGGVTAAAQALGLAQSTVSEALSSLERAVGASVFVRKRGSHDVVLTDAGEALLPHARAMLAAIEAAHTAVASATPGARGRIAIATNESISTYLLGPALDAARRRWPATSFEVTIMMCAGVRAGVEAGEFDLGLMLHPAAADGSSPGVERRVVAEDVPLVIFAAPSHPLANGHLPVKREALARYPLFLSDAAGDFHLLVRRFLEQERMPGAQLQPTGSIESVKRGVERDSRALGMLPTYALADEIRLGRVVRLTVRPGPPCMRLEAMLSKTRTQHPATDPLIDAVQSLYQSITVEAQRAAGD